MKLPYNGDFRITQYFNDPCCRESYHKFLVLNHEGIRVPLPGHNGVDFGLPHGTPVIAPHAGTVIEATFDPLGYGWYIKIENDQEGSVLAHLANNSIIVVVGQVVDEGQKLALSDNTGNSTGEHLHWGYYRKPRDRANGFGGFEDQLPYMDDDVEVPPPADDNMSQVVLVDEHEINAWRVFQDYRRVRTDFNNEPDPEGNFEGFARDIVENDRVYQHMGHENPVPPVSTPPSVPTDPIPTPTPIPPQPADPIKDLLAKLLARILEILGQKHGNN